MSRLTIITIIIVFLHAPSNGESIYSMRQQAIDTTTHRFVVSPSLHSEIIDSVSNVYCSSIAISWNSLQENIFKGPVLLEKNISWVDFLNRESKNKSISKEYFSVFSGFGSDNVLSKFRQDVLNRFGYHYNPQISISNSSIYSFSFMKKKLVFESDLGELESENLRFNGEANIAWFGFYSGWDDNHGAVNIHDYKSDDDFILQIEAEGGDDEIYFAKIKPAATLLETYLEVIKRVHRGSLSQLTIKDEVKIPYLNFQLKKEFEEIEGVKILNEKYKKYTFDKIIQIIDFDLNETGISVESLTEVHAVFGGRQKVIPRKLIFDKPFLIIMKEKSLNAPYLLLWIGNNEFMRRK